ncbi:MAG: hypothetical protein QOE39_4717, partial [Bradyrhizobium sp.]|nr:hypothetical protein [Bradyrhizobium sp.]
RVPLSALPSTVPVPVPLVSLNTPVPPSNVAARWIVTAALHEHGFGLRWTSWMALMRWSVPDRSAHMSAHRRNFHEP